MGSGNNMIDGDPGTHPFSPKFKQPKEIITIYSCTLCGDYTDESGDTVQYSSYEEYDKQGRLHVITEQCVECLKFNNNK
jgi:hypothetical protein